MAKRGKGIVSLLAVAWAIALSLTAATPAHAQSAAPASRAVLVRGTLTVRGVGHFPANAISALYGEYRWGNSTVRVWVAREELFLSGAWTEYSLRQLPGGSLKAYRKDATEDGLTIIAYRASGYWTIAEFPASAGNPRSFLEPFSERFQYFVSRAASPSDVSLPAVLETR